MRVLHKLKYQHAAQIKHTAHYLGASARGWDGTLVHGGGCLQRPHCGPDVNLDSGRLIQLIEM